MIVALRRRWRPIAGIAILCGAALLGWMVHVAMSMPVARQLTFPADYPDGVPRLPVRIALVSDSHVSGFDMSPARLAGIVDAINAQKPDLVLLAGDYLGNDKWLGKRYSARESIAPFAGLRAPLGVLAVLGNHDYWDDSRAEVRRALADAGATVLANQAVQRGPLAIGGVDDLINGRPDIGKTVAAVRRIRGVPILFAHEPDIFVLAKDFGPLMLVGHTHCGQVSLPLIGPPWIPSKVGSLYPCGRYDEPGRTLIVGGGIGTSALPIRLGAPPEYWVVTIVPKN